MTGCAMVRLADDGMLALSPARDSDWRGIVALANAAFRGTGGWNAETGLIEGDRIGLDLLAEDLEAEPDAILLVHRVARDLLACVKLAPKSPGIWHLGLLAVRPDLQARQIGRRVLEAAEEYARRRGGVKMRIGVIDARDTLIAWYERRGYRLTGESEPFPYGDDRFGRPLRPDMRFLILEKELR